MTKSSAVSRRSAVRLALAALLVALAPVALAPVALAHDEAAMPGADDTWNQALTGMFDRTTGKLVALAGAIPEDDYGWRPDEGVRSVSEALMHTASANYALAAGLGTERPADVPEDLEAMSGKAEVEKWLQASIDHVRGAMEQASGDMDTKVEIFGQEMSKAVVAMIVLDHNAEHLGQLIAYGRSNGVVPPWSQPQSPPQEAAADSEDGEGDAADGAEAMADDDGAEGDGSEGDG